MTNEIIAALKSLEGFSTLEESALSQMIPFISTRVMRAGETIFCQGEPSPFCFGVISGEIVIQRVSKDRRFPAKLLGVVTTGGLFGESAMFEDYPRAAMASSSKDGKLLTMRGPQLREWLQKNPQLAQPLVMALWKTSLSRLQSTSEELSVVYGVGRLLGSDKEFLTQLAASLDFLRGSLKGLDHLVFYSRSTYWEEFTPLMSFPGLPALVSIPSNNALIQKVSKAGVVQSFDPKEIQSSLNEFRLPWEQMAAIAILPLFDWDKSPDPLQGLLVLASDLHARAFSSEKQLLLTSLSHPLAEALSRHARQEDSSALARLQQSKKPFPPE